MAERASLSIDGYTNSQNATLAEDIVVNSTAFNRITQAGKIRQKFYVVRTNELPPERTFGLGRKKRHPALKNGGAVFLKVNDGLLLEKAKRRARRRSDNNEGNYHALTREEFVRGLNWEVTSGLKSTLTDKVSLKKHIGDYVGLITLGVITLAHVPPTSIEDWKTLAIMGGATGLGFWLDRKDTQPFSPASFIRGYWQILKNQSQLIVDRNAPLS